MLTIAAILLTATAPAAQDFEIFPIAVTGDPAPGGVGVFDRPVLNAVLNEEGEVAFAARLTQTTGGIFDDDVLIVGDSDSWEILAQEGDPSPDGNGVYGSPFPQNPFVSVFVQPGFGDLGEAISTANFLAASHTTGIISARRGQPTEVLIRDGYTYNSGQLQVVQLRVGIGSANSFGSTGVLIDMAEGGGAPFSGFWRVDENGVHRVVAVGDDLPELGGEVVQIADSWIGINEFETTVTFANIQSDPFESAKPVLIRSDSGGIDALAGQGQPAPGGGIYSGTFGRPVINTNGQVAFLAGVAELPAGSQGYGAGIFRSEAAGATQLVIQVGNPAPDGDGIVTALVGPNIGSAGHLTTIAAFEAVDGVTVDAGVIAGQPGSLEMVVRTGQPFPLGGETFGTAFSPAHVNGNGTVALAATNDTSLYAGLFAKRPGEPLIEIVRPGDTLAGRVIETVELPGIHDSGGRAVINDSEEIVFTVYFTNGDTGIFQARLCQGDAAQSSCGSLSANRKAMSLVQGGAVEFELDAGPGLAGAIYILLGTTSGTQPGLALPSLTIPLNPVDPYFQLTAGNPSGAPASGSLGVLDGYGRASASLALAPNAVPVLAGVTAHHAFLAFDIDPQFTERFASNAVPLTLLP